MRGTARARIRILNLNDGPAHVSHARPCYLFIGVRISLNPT